MLNNLKKFNTSKTTEKILATFLVISLTFTNFILLCSYMGKGMVSYASEINLTKQSDETNNEHVKFEIYLDKNDRSINQINKDINSQDLVLYASVNVKNGGYLSEGKIEFIDSNFDLKNDIEKKSFDLDIIQSGKPIEISFPVVAKKDDVFNLGLLDMISQIKMTGKYIDNDGKTINIDTTKGVKVCWTSESISEENNPIKLNQEVLTNRTCEINGTNKRIMQLKVTSGLENNAYPIKTTSIILQVPALNEVYPEEVVVASYGTMATNNKTAIGFEKDDVNVSDEDKIGIWSYNEENKTVNITINNKPDNNKVSWTKSGEDTFIITYIYPETTKTEEVYSKVESRINLYTSNSELTSTKEFTQKIGEVQSTNGDILQLNSKSTNVIYKGNMNVAKNTEFVNVWDLGISYVGVSNSILVGNDMQKDYFNDNTEEIAKVEYKTTYINKADMLDILGEEGEIYIFNNEDIKNEDIQNSTPLIVVNKDTNTDEDGNIVVEYDSGIERVCALTSVPEKEGKLSIVNIKEINTQEYSKEEIQKIEKISTYNVANTIDVKYGSITVGESLIEEPISVATLEVDKNKLSTTQENEINFTVTLKEDDIKYDLYTNPHIEIELPSFVTSVGVEESNIKVINGNGLEFGSKDVITNNGKKIIVVNLQGEQIEYNDNTQILIKANLLTNKLIPSLTENLILRCTNGKETVYENEQSVSTSFVEIETVAEQGILLATTVNNYAEAQPEITLLKSETQSEPGLLNADVGVVTATVKGTIINNSEGEVSNIVALGKINKEDILTKLASIITANGKVYYTEDKNVTLESSWVSEYTENTTGYKIEFNSLEKNAVEVFSYNIELPENIGTNKNMSINYEIYNEDVKTVSPSVLLQTQQEANLELKVVPIVENDKKVYEGQKLSYEITVKNIGGTEAKEIVVNNPVPDGTSIVKNNEEQWEIDTLKAGETFAKTIDLTVNNLADGEETKEIENKTIVTARYLDEDLTSVVKNKVGKANIIVIFKLDKNYDNVELKSQISYIISITNNTTEKIENLSVENSMPKEINYTHIGFIGMPNSFNKTEDNKYKSIEISLEPNQTKNLQINGEIINYNKEGLINNIVLNWGETETATYQDIREIEIPQPIKIVLTSDKEGKELKTEDKITYIATVTNEGEEDVSTNIASVVSEALGIIKVETIERTEEIQTVISEIQTAKIQQAKTNLELAPKETKLIRITATVVANAEKIEDDLNVAAQVAAVRGSFIEESNVVTNIIKKVEPIKDIDNTTNPTAPTNPNNSTVQTKSNENNTYSIYGTAWLDENKNGKIDSNEKLLNNIVVKIKNSSTDQFLKDTENKEITAITNDKGEYVFNNLKPGKYILIFDCDLKTYGVTTGNSQAVLATENGVTNIKTDVIEITNKNISNINAGLILNPKFDLQLTKYITKVTVKDLSETKVYNYDKSQLAKVEIPAKKVKGSLVIIEYTIDVTNKGEVPGYAKSIVDYISPELKFSSETNTSWYKGTDNNLYCIDLTNDEIKPGETKSVKLILTKTMTEDNMGLVNNIAEICEDYNEYAIEDTNSKTFNQNEKENDLSSANIIISVKTGSPIMYIGIVIASALILGTGIYLINKKVILA